MTRVKVRRRRRRGRLLRIVQGPVAQNRPVLGREDGIAVEGEVQPGRHLALGNFFPGLRTLLVLEDLSGVSGYMRDKFMGYRNELPILAEPLPTQVTPR